MTKQTLKRWLISTAITFAGGFAIALYPQIDNVTLESFKDGSLLGLLFVCARQGLKFVVELFVMWFNNR